MTCSTEMCQKISIETTETRNGIEIEKIDSPGVSALIRTHPSIAHSSYSAAYYERQFHYCFVCTAYGKHSSSRGNSRLRWPQDPEGPNSGGAGNSNSSTAAIHRRRIEGCGGSADNNPDMDISAGDSTPTSEASYAHSGTPTATISSHNQHHPQADNNNSASLGASAAAAAAGSMQANALSRHGSHLAMPSASATALAASAGLSKLVGIGGKASCDVRSAVSSVQLASPTPTSSTSSLLSSVAAAHLAATAAAVGGATNHHNHQSQHHHQQLQSHHHSSELIKRQLTLHLRYMTES